jgi:hypothetical protein
MSLLRVNAELAASPDSQEHELQGTVLVKDGYVPYVYVVMISI